MLLRMIAVLRYDIMCNTQNRRCERVSKMIMHILYIQIIFVGRKAWHSYNECYNASLTIWSFTVMIIIRCYIKKSWTCQQGVDIKY